MEMPTSSKSFRTPLNQRLSFWLIVLLLVVILFVFIIFRSWNRQSTARQSLHPPVVTAVATRQDVPVYLKALGSVVPTYSVTVRTQINGQLIHVFYKEGQHVKKGDLLAEIDPRPYEAQLLQYQGQLTRDLALLANARVDLKRYQTLWRQDSVAQQTLQTQKSLVEQYEGAVQIDRGLIAGVEVNLAYSKITSPIDGRVGLRLVDPGNVVQTSDTNGLLIINTLNPITVVFSIPEDNISDVMRKFTAEKGLAVEAYDRQQHDLLASGKLLTVDNQIDVTTGTVKLKAQFENDQGILFPNQFVNIQTLVKTLLQVTVVPTAAIQFSSQGSFAYLVNADETVSYVPIKTGITVGETTVVESGIQPGQTVVTEGADRLSNGMKVTIGKPANAIA